MRLPQEQSFRETHLRGVWAEDDTDTQTTLVIHSVNFLNFFSGRIPRTAQHYLPCFYLPEYNSCSPMTGSCVCAVDDGNDYRDNDDDDDSDGDEY